MLRDSASQIAALAFYLTLAACSKDAEPPAAGICLRASPVASLGDLNDSISITSNDVDVAPLQSRGWLVIDRRGPKDILLYDKEGRFQGQFVRRGLGPGEINSPARLAIDRTDSVWITDGAGRVQLVGPDGSLGRMIVPFTGRVSGFTDDGLPFELVVKGVESDTAVPYVRFWTRSGESMQELGPGSSVEWKTGRSVQVLNKNFWAPSNQTAWSGFKGSTGAWIEEWTAAGVRPLITQQAVWARLADPPATPERTWMVGVVGVNSTSFLGLARLPAPSSPQPGNPPFLAVLFHASGTGEIHSAILLKDAPAGFADSKHYFSVVDDESGLRKIQITKVDLTCSS